LISQLKGLSIRISHLVFAVTAIAYSGLSTASHQYYDLTLKEISMGWGGEAVYVRVTENVEVMDGCAGRAFVMLPSTPLFQENYSMLIAAFHAKQKVGLYINGCIGNNMALRAVRVRS